MTGGRYENVLTELERQPRVWLITGVAGFIGSHLLETLLRHKQKVVGLDNFSTGKKENLTEVKKILQKEGCSENWSLFALKEGDLRDQKDCADACQGVEIVLHQGALGSVPRSITDPATSEAVNSGGFVNILFAAKEARVRRFIYASSSAVYGDDQSLPKVEEITGKALSPYALTKQTNEEYARLCANLYSMVNIGLRYFNVFGPRQDPNGAYAAVIPRWIALLLKNQECTIYGDGETSRDFCYVDNVVQANILAAITPKSEPFHQAYNVAVGDRTTLKELFAAIRQEVATFRPEAAKVNCKNEAFRAGDVRHSLADISRVSKELGYLAQYDLATGLKKTIKTYLTN